MPNGSNPYIEEGTGDWGFNVPFDELINMSGTPFNALQYILGVSDEEAQQYYNQFGDIWGQTMGSVGMNPGFSYQGMSPEIMGAIGNVFGEAQGPSFGDLWESSFGEGSSELSQNTWDEFQSNLYGNLGEAGFTENLIDTDGDGIPDSWSGGGGTFEPWNYGFSGGDTWGQFGQGGLSNVNVFDPESIANTLSQIEGIEDSIRPGEVKALTPEMLKKTESAYYDPYESTQRQSLVEKLGKARGGVSTGGFAGSGARQSGLSGAERLYRGGYEDILGDIMKMRGSATEDVMDTIYGWQELMTTQ